MNIAHYGEAVLAATIVSSFTDWFFFGVLFHSPLSSVSGGLAERILREQRVNAILMATVLSVFMATAFLLLVHGLGMHGFLHPLKLVLAIWAIAVAPIHITNFVFMKLHPAVLVSHLLGWLVRLVIFAATFGVILDR